MDRPSSTTNRRTLLRSRTEGPTEPTTRVAWAQARLRRARQIGYVGVLLYLGVVPFILGNPSGIHGRVLLVAVNLCFFVGILLAVFSWRTTFRRAEALAGALIEAATAIIEATPNTAAAPMSVRQRRGAQLLVTAAVVIWFPVASYVVNGPLRWLYVVIALLLAIRYVATAARNGRNQWIGADLNAEGLALPQFATRVPWTEISTATVSLEGGTCLITWPISDPRAMPKPTRRLIFGPRKPKTLSISMNAVRERPLDILVASRRYIETSRPAA